MDVEKKKPELTEGARKMLIEAGALVEPEPSAYKQLKDAHKEVKDKTVVAAKSAWHQTERAGHQVAEVVKDAFHTTARKSEDLKKFLKTTQRSSESLGSAKEAPETHASKCGAVPTESPAKAFSLDGALSHNFADFLGSDK